MTTTRQLHTAVAAHFAIRIRLAAHPMGLSCCI